MDRRELLYGATVVAASAIAGCAEDESENGTTNEADSAGDTEEANDTDEGTGGNGSSDGGDAAVEDGEDDSTGNETAGDENETVDDGNESIENETDNESIVNDTTGNESENDTAADGEVSLADVVETEESYAFESATVSGAGEAATSGRVDGENTYLSIDDGSGALEVYTVEGETYVVDGEECTSLPGMAGDVATDEGVDDPTTEIDSQPDVPSSGRETIDGEEVYVFELDAEQPAAEGEVTYYVSVETGYVRRVESSGSATDFHSWGEADPVSPPELECTDLGGMNETDLPL